MKTYIFEFGLYCAQEEGSEKISGWRSIIIRDTLGERFWKQQFHDVCREWSSEKIRDSISCSAVRAGPRGNGRLLFLNSSHLANWEHLRAPELKFPSGLTLDNQWPCPKRGRMEGKALRPKDWLRNPSTSRIKRLKTPLLTKVFFTGDSSGSFSSLWCFRLLMSWAWLVCVNWNYCLQELKIKLHFYFELEVECIFERWNDSSWSFSFLLEIWWKVNWKSNLWWYLFKYSLVKVKKGKVNKTSLEPYLMVLFPLRLI